MAPVVCLVKKKIDATHRLMKCYACGNEHIVEVKINKKGGWSSPPGSRDCRNPKCKANQVHLAAKRRAAQERAIANPPEGYDTPEIY